MPVQHIPVLKVHNLTKIYSSGFWPFNRSSYTAVDNLSFELGKGEILGLLGANGAGKTTTLQMLLGTLIPSSGSIIYFGSDFSRNRTTLLKRIGYASGYDRLPARLTVSENLDIVGRIYGLSRSRRLYQISKLLKFFGMWELRDKQMGGLSAGQTTRVMLAKAFIADPEIVLLDEPTASLDPDIAYQVRQFILMQQAEHVTSILITSHNMAEVTELCDRVLVLKKGMIIANNTPEQLAQSTSRSRIHLTFTHHCLEEAKAYLDLQGFCFRAKGPTECIIEIDESSIAPLLVKLSEKKLLYTQISIDKPTLEDYFLSITK